MPGISRGSRLFKMKWTDHIPFLCLLMDYVAGCGTGGSQSFATFVENRGIRPWDAPIKAGVYCVMSRATLPGTALRLVVSVVILGTKPISARAERLTRLSSLVLVILILRMMQRPRRNSLTEVEIGKFCEDFLRLLNFNKTECLASLAMPTAAKQVSSSQS